MICKFDLNLKVDDVSGKYDEFDSDELDQWINEGLGPQTFRGETSRGNNKKEDSTMSILEFQVFVKSAIDGINLRLDNICNEIKELKEKTVEEEYRDERYEEEKEEEEKDEEEEEKEEEDDEEKEDEEEKDEEKEDEEEKDDEKEEEENDDSENKEDENKKEVEEDKEKGSKEDEGRNEKKYKNNEEKEDESEKKENEVKEMEQPSKSTKTNVLAEIQNVQKSKKEVSFVTSTQMYIDALRGEGHFSEENYKRRRERRKKLPSSLLRSPYTDKFGSAEETKKNTRVVDTKENSSINHIEPPGFMLLSQL